LVAGVIFVGVSVFATLDVYRRARKFEVSYFRGEGGNDLYLRVLNNGPSADFQARTTFISDPRLRPGWPVPWSDYEGPTAHIPEDQFADLDFVRAQHATAVVNRVSTATDTTLTFGRVREPAWFLALGPPPITPVTVEVRISSSLVPRATAHKVLRLRILVPEQWKIEAEEPPR
jgi:hypothetical protein